MATIQADQSQSLSLNQISGTSVVITTRAKA